MIKVLHNGELKTVKKVIVPRKWKRLEYLESTGTLWIDTGIIPTQAHDFEITFMALDFNTSGSINTILGMRNSFQQPQLRLRYSSSINSLGIEYGDDYKLVSINSTPNVKQTVTFRNSKLNEVSVTNSTYTGMLYTMALFSQNELGNITRSYAFIGRIYSCKLYSQDTLVRDFVPCDYNGLLGMWDLVENKFYGNKGTGLFIGGPEEKNYDEVSKVRVKTDKGFSVSKLYGKSLVWNLLVDVSNKVTDVSGGFTVTALGNGGFSISGTSTGGYNYNFASNIKLLKGHVYIIGEANITSSSNHGLLRFYDSVTKTSFGDKRSGLLRITAAQDYTLCSLYFNCGGANATVTGTIYPKIIDLTLMFGAGNEPSTVAEFESWLALNNVTDFSYNAGEKKNMCFGTGVKSEVKNLVDVDKFFTDAGWTKNSEGYTGAISLIHNYYNNNVYPINENDITFSFDAKAEPTTSDPSTVYIQIFYTDNTNLSNSTKVYSTGWTHFSASSNLNKLVLGIKLSYGSGRNYTIKNFSVVKGRNEICPFSKQISWNELWLYMPNGLCSAGNVKDEVEFRLDCTIITKKVNTINLGDFTWNDHGTITNWYTITDVNFASAGAKIKGNGIMTTGYTLTNLNQPPSKNFAIVVSLNDPDKSRLIVEDDDYINNLSGFVQYISKHKLIYELANPIQYILPPINTSLPYEANGVVEGLYEELSAPIDYETNNIVTININ